MALVTSQTKQKQKWALASAALQDTFTDFVLSRQAMLCTPATVKWYSWTLAKFLEHANRQGIALPEEITAQIIRQYLSGLAGQGLSDSYIHNHARAIKTFMRFCLSESYIVQPVKFTMPTIGKKRLHVLNGKELVRLLASCDEPRDEALIMFLADTGTRRAELCALNWGDINLENGVTRIAQGKGKKARSVIVGIKTRRALLKYRRTLTHQEDAPLFQSRKGGRLSPNGLRGILKRAGKRAGLQVSPHVLRRTFATLSLRAGMNVLHLQGLMGHSTLAMTQHYVQMLEDDLLTAHQEHGPVDNL